MTQVVNTVFRATNQTGPAVRGAVGGLKAVRDAQAALNATNRSWNKGLSENRRGIQQFGFQIGDFATQVAGGQSAVLAFTQQGSQMLQFFGPAGSIMAAFLAVFGAVFIAMNRAGIGMKQMSPALGLLQEDLTLLGGTLRAIGGVFVDVGNLIVNNLMLIVTAVTIAATAILYRYVTATVGASLATGRLVVVANAARAMVLSVAMSYTMGGAAAAGMTVATNVLSGAMYVLRAALVSLGFPIIVMLIATAVQWFMALRRGAGSLGEAFKLLGDVAKGIMQGVSNYAEAAALMLSATFKVAVAAVIGYFSLLARAWDGVANGIILTNNALADTKIGSSMGMAAMEYSDVAGSLRNSAGDVLSSAAGDVAKAGALWNAATGTADAYAALMAAYDKGAVDIDLRDISGTGGKTAGGGGGGGDSMADKMSEEAQRVKSIFEDMQRGISDSMMSAFKGLLNGTKTMGDAMRDILADILDRVITILMQPIFDGIAGGIGKSLMGVISGGVASFDGGGFTGRGARAGGMDGKGGKLAMLHPNETVTDHTKGGSALFRVPGGAGGGSPTVNVTVDARGAQKGVAEEVASQLAKTLPTILRQSVLANNSARSRGYA
jgi:hypothetical protein